MICVETSDGQIHQVARADADVIGYLREVAEGGAEPFPIESVDGKTFAKMLSFCKVVAQAGKREDIQSFVEIAAVREWCENNCSTTAERMQLMQAANYLEFPLLHECCCRLVADSLTGLSVSQVREFFGMPTTLTQEEIDRIEKAAMTIAFE